MLSRLTFALIFLTTSFVAATVEAAPRKLPVGEAVSYSGAACGQISRTWLPGAIDNRGRFETLSSSLSALKKQIKRLKGKKKSAMQKKITKLQLQITNQTAICSQLGTGIIAATGAQSAAIGSTTVSWVADFFTLGLSNSAVGSEFNFFCPANGALDTVVGSDTYGGDSSICNAAVHAGVITRQFGGNVRARFKAGQNFYLGGIRNGVTALLGTSYAYSFSFINPGTNAEVSSPAPVILDWFNRITLFRPQLGTTFTFLCAANGTLGTIYGTSFYTDDSTVCTAALHAGKISTPRGGQISVLMSQGRASYAGSKKRGVTSFSYGSWSGSYSFN